MVEPLENSAFPKNIDQLIKLPDFLIPVYEKRKKDAMVGSYENIKARFHRLPIVEGWATYGPALRDQGAIVAVRYKIPMVNTDVVPEKFVPYFLEHEVVESALDSDPSTDHDRVAYGIISELDLNRSARVSRPRWNHALAVIHQMRMAQKDGLLDEMMQFMDDLELRERNKRDAVGNKEFRLAVYSFFNS